MFGLFSCVSGAKTFTAVFEVQLAAGLYETGTKNMKKSWDQLESEGIVTSDGVAVDEKKDELAGDLVLPDSLTNIDMEAFQFCESLTWNS